jgi:hypothetical protein
MQEFNYQDPLYDLTNSEKYNLSIQVNLDGFSILVQDTISQSVYLLDHTPFQLTSVSGLIRKSTEMLSLKQLTGKKFNQVSIITESQQVKLIPQFLQTGKNLKGLFNLFQRDMKGYEVIVTPFNTRYCSAFLWPTGLLELFNSVFPGCLFVSESVPLLHHIQDESSDETNQRIGCHFHPGYFLMYAFRGNELQFFNTFSYSSQEDILYFISAYIRQSGENTRTIRLSGVLNQNWSVLELLRMYYSNVEILQVNCSRFDTGDPEKFDFHVLSPVLSYNRL